MTTSDLFEYAKNSLRKLSHPKKSLNSVRSGQPTPPPPPPSRWELYPVTCKKTNVKQGAHIHQQPTAWLIPHACRQIYHPGSGSRGPFRPYCGSSGIFFFAASPLSRAPDKTAMLRRLCNNRSLWRILSSNYLVPLCVQCKIKLMCTAS